MTEHLKSQAGEPRPEITSISHIHCWPRVWSLATRHSRAPFVLQSLLLFHLRNRRRRRLLLPSWCSSCLITGCFDNTRGRAQLCLCETQARNQMNTTPSYTNPPTTDKITYCLGVYFQLCQSIYLMKMLVFFSRPSESFAFLNCYYNDPNLRLQNEETPLAITNVGGRVMRIYRYTRKALSVIHVSDLLQNVARLFADLNLLIKQH